MTEGAAQMRQELEARMQHIEAIMRSEFAAVRAETKLANDRQDEEWNKGFRAIRDDQAKIVQMFAGQITDQMNEGFKQIRLDLRSFVTTDVFVARIGPLQAVAYGLVSLLMALMTGMLAASLYRGK
jgi:hypothetical protein